MIVKPVGKVPAPLNVVFQQWNNDNPLDNRLAKPVIEQYEYPTLHQNDVLPSHIRVLIAAELAEKAVKS